MWQQLLGGAAAGAAGTTALDTVTYLDMALRGRSASDIPEQTVQHLLDLVHLDLPGDAATAENRLQGLGYLGGLLTGVTIGAAYGVLNEVVGRPSAGLGALLVGAGALVGANGPMAVLGVTDPRAWTTADWLSDVVPHVAYGVVTAFTYDAIVSR